MHPNFKKLLIIWIIFLVGAIIFEYFYYRHNIIPLKVSYLDVGQGDATLIDYQNSQQILIDGGPNGKVLLNDLGKEMPLLDRKIEVVVLTHPDSDHIAGLIDLAKTYDIGVVLDNGQTSDTETYQELDTIIKEKKIRREHLQEGSELRLGKDLTINVYNPDGGGENSEDRNDESVVLRMDYGRNSFLFTGDAEQPAEQDMLQDQENLDVDWLKVSHHGSRTGSSSAFLEKVTPKYAIISVGRENRYGHPHAQTLERLQASGAKILRTDELGTIDVICRQKEQECQLKQ